MKCAECGHLIEWHDDRIITPCMLRNPFSGRLIACACPGWRAA